MLTLDQHEMTVPGGGDYRGGGGSWFRRILVPVRAPDQAYPALAVAERICAPGNGVLRLVHVRSCEPPLPIVGRLYLETPGEATAVLEESLLAAWACGGPRATTVVVDARRDDVAAAIAWQAAAWPADLIVLTRRPRPALSRLVRGSVPDQVMRKASCPVLAIPPARTTASTAPPGLWHTESGRRPS